MKIDNGAVLKLENGSYPNLGSVQLNSTGANTVLEVAGANVTLSGGSVTMSNNAANYIFGVATADTLTNQETIQGAGDIGFGQMTLVNSGTINANQSAGLTIQANGGATNTGTIEATGGTLALIGTTVANAGGTISTSGQTLQLTNTTINGGAVTLTGAATLQLYNGIIHSGSTLTNSSTGTIEAFAGSNTLGGTITNPAGGVVKIDNGAVLNLENGSYPNLGSVQLNSTGANTVLEVAGANVTLSGGSVTMSNNAANYILGAVGTDTLTNQETIQGAGNIGDGRMTLVNSGTINANQTNALTLQISNGATNTGTIEATSGGTLIVFGGTYANAGGKILNTASTLEFQGGTTINGGTISQTGAGTMKLSDATINTAVLNSTTGTIEVIGSGNTIAGTLTNPKGGQVKIDNSSTLTMGAGSSISNAGAITLNSMGSTTELLIGANVTISGMGTLTMSNNSANFIQGVVGTEVLTNKSTIQGAGTIGNGFLGLVNTGTIIANQPTELFIKPNAAGGFNNTGTLTVASGSTLDITGGTFKNFNSGTSTLTAGIYKVTGTLQFDNANIVTNAANITLTGATSQIINQSSVNALTNFAANAPGANFGLASGRNFTTAGNFTNNGTLTVGSGTKFDVNGNLTNFSGTTLTGGAYLVSGTLQFNGANIVNNAATITLTGATSKIVDQTSANGLANFANNSGTFTLATGRTLTTTGSFTNSGITNVLKGTTFTVGGAGNFTQTGGTTTTDGKLTTAGAINIQGGTLFGNAGTLTGSLNLTGGTVAPGDGLKKAGDLNISGSYTQSSGGILNIDLGGTIANTKYDVLNIAGAATLGATLNVDLISGFIPVAGDAFTVMNYTSETGTFATTNFPAVSGDHWTIAYNPTNVVLTLVAGPAALSPQSLRSSSIATSTATKQSGAALTVSTRGTFSRAGDG